MPDLSIQYLGLTLKNPIIVGACKLTADLPTILEAEKAGAAAIVCASLFEEQIQLEQYKLELETQSLANVDSEISSFFPENVRHSGPEQHLMWVRKTKEAVKIPVIASINAVSKEAWVDYAISMEKTGVDALELNFYYTPRDLNRSGADIEAEQIDILKAVKKAVKIPVSVKLSFFYSNPLNVIKQMDEAGAAGVVLFNRLFESDIDVTDQKHTKPFNLSNEGDNKLPNRFVGLLHGNVKTDLCANTGILNSRDAIKAILSGATCFQVVTTLYLHKLSYIGNLIADIGAWMDQKGYASLADFRGNLAQKNLADKLVYKRAQYVDLILNSDKLMNL
jgi:dihydroorotate dehydrogenase (fumarate)